MKMRAVILIALVSIAVGAAGCQKLPDADTVTNRRMLLSQKLSLAQLTPLNSRLRVDGLGIAGAKLTELLGNINAFAWGESAADSQMNICKNSYANSAGPCCAVQLHSVAPTATWVELLLLQHQSHPTVAYPVLMHCAKPSFSAKPGNRHIHTSRVFCTANIWHTAYPVNCQLSCESHLHKHQSIPYVRIENRAVARPVT